VGTSCDIVKLVEGKRKEGHRAFKEFKMRHGIKSKKITDRECQHLMKVGRDNEGYPYFKPYHGLTYMSMVPPPTTKQLAPPFIALKQRLDEIGLGDRFLYVPEDTYHITFQGLEERSAPSVSDPREIKYYKTKYPLKSDDIPFKAKVSGFSCYTNLVIFAEVIPEDPPVCFRIAEKTKRKNHFHLTIAYFVDPISETDKAQLKSCLRDMSKEHLTPPVSLEISDVHMYRFESMAKYVR
jgi:hypothetical protein